MFPSYKDQSWFIPRDPLAASAVRQNLKEQVALDSEVKALDQKAQYFRSELKANFQKMEMAKDHPVFGSLWTAYNTTMEEFWPRSKGSETKTSVGTGSSTS